MTTSKRVTAAKAEQWHKNIDKRGKVPKTTKSSQPFSVGPIMLGFFLFVVVGSALLQIIRTATARSPDDATTAHDTPARGGSTL